MATTKVSQVLQNTIATMYNPNAMQDAVTDTLLGINNGVDYDVLDPNNPVIWSSEASVLLAQTSIESHTKTLQRRNAVMAVDMEDLYGHMSEEDWIDPFSQPSRAEFRLIIGKNEIIEKAAPRNSRDMRKLVIPRDTEFMVGGVTFTLQYPIEIRVLTHGGLQIVYDNSVDSPITSLSSRSLDWSINTIPFDGKPIEMVVITIPALQYKITSHVDTITRGISWRSTFAYDDQYFYARVWNRVNGKWKEIKTTHSDEVINPTEVTAQMKVLNGELEVYIPDVYVRTGLISGEIRVDVYATKGEVDMNLPNYDVSEYTARWMDIGKTTDTQHIAPLNTFKHFSLIADSRTRGGRNGLTFEELRKRVIDNSFSGRVLPISEKQLVNSATDMGFDVNKSIDYVTERIYHATSTIPTPAIDGLSTPIGTVNGILETSVGELTDSGSVKNNGNRITILPTTLYKYVNGLVQVDDRTLDDYRRMEPNQLVSYGNDNTLLYTPFHYVLDFNGNIVEERAYYLSNPKIDNKRFVSNNNTLNLDVSTKQQQLKEVDGGYLLTVVTRSDDTYKSLTDAQKHAQISFTPRGYSEEYAWVNGTLKGHNADGEAIFEFYIETNLDIDRNHDMVVTNFTLVGDKPSPTAMFLECPMNVIYSVSNYTTPEYRTSTIDQILDSPVRGAKGATYEVLSLNFGQHLPSLWTNARTIVGSVDYKRHEDDVYMTYSKDVLKKDPATNAPAIEFETVDGKLKAKFIIEHKKGDFVLDKFGEKQIQFPKGSPVYGVDGKPEVKSPRSIKRRLELFLMDAKFILSNTDETTAYRNLVTDTLLGYITKDLPSIDTSLLEKTELYYYPETTMGLIDVLLGDGTTTRIDAENQFNMYYYLTSASRQNSDFLDTIAETTRSAILVNLKGDTVSVSAITEEIRKRLGDEIVDVEMGAMGPYKDQKLFTVTDSRNRPTLGKKLVLNPDWTLSIRDDISIGYNSHEVKK